MRIRARTIVLGLLAVVVGVAVIGISSIGWEVVLGPKARPVTNRTFQATEARLARGQYLVENVAACFHCHSEHDLGTPRYPINQAKKGAGWAMPIPELPLVASNLTPDKETGPTRTWRRSSSTCGRSRR
jgi:hypothetical protein